ncbi:MAG TPA: sigma-70 family RNA polymerase sigma factor [Longimicrobiaceae bacterium]|nr:sigma-70 family RNA polymerase sigma factor [Longimicrobiaceae bacterium]
MNETQLIESAKQGDGGAIQALYGLYSRRVYAIVRRLAGEDALAEDWAQETWIRALRALPAFRGDSRFSTWLHRIAVNTALHARRGRERRAGREEPLADEVVARPSGGDAVLRLRLERAIARLPEGMRRVLVLHDVEGYTHEEIGEMLGIAPGTCKSQLFKARARMRQILAPAEDPVEGVATCST